MQQVQNFSFLHSLVNPTWREWSVERMRASIAGHFRIQNCSKLFAGREQFCAQICIRSTPSTRSASSRARNVRKSRFPSLFPTKTSCRRNRLRRTGEFDRHPRKTRGYYVSTYVLPPTIPADFLLLFRRMTSPLPVLPTALFHPPECDSKTCKHPGTPLPIERFSAVLSYLFWRKVDIDCIATAFPLAKEQFLTTMLTSPFNDAFRAPKDKKFKGKNEEEMMANLMLSITVDMML